MLLKEKRTGALVKVLDTDALIDPMSPTVSARIQAGQEEQDPEKFPKEALLFPSNEQLPQCWLNPDYKQ